MGMVSSQIAFPLSSWVVMNRLTGERGLVSDVILVMVVLPVAYLVALE
jgi:hypothetical protein